MNIEPVRENVYRVTLDRDGTITSYEFIQEIPSRPELPPSMDEPMEIVKDLIDYQEFAPPGQSQGVFDIPPIDDIVQYVFTFADGKPLEFPIVLDER